MKKNNEKYNAAFDLINRNLKFYSNKAAFIDDNEKVISYQELSCKVQNTASNLQKVGFNKKDKVIICLVDSINYPISFLGAIWGGIIPICINTMLPEKDLKYMLEDSQAKGVICSEQVMNFFLEYKQTKKNDLIVIQDTKTGIKKKILYII